MPLIDYERNFILTLWLPQITGNPRTLEQSCDTTIAFFAVRPFPLHWCSINHLICVKKVSSYFCIIGPIISATVNEWNWAWASYHCSLLVGCLVMLCLLDNFFDHLRMTSILFDVNMFCRFFFTSRLVNWVISDSLVHKGLKNRKISQVIYMFIGFIMCIVLLKNRIHDLSMFTNPCITLLFT